MSARRDDMVTITMSALQWDAVRRENYVESGEEYRAKSIIEAATGPADERYEEARLEALATLPPLTREVKRRLSRHVGELVQLREDNGPIGDHLGRGDGWPKGMGGWEVCCIRWTDGGGWPNMHFRRTDVWFDHHEIPMSEDQRKALIKMVAKHREVVDVWHSGSWLSVTWKPRGGR